MGRQVMTEEKIRLGQPPAEIFERISGEANSFFLDSGMNHEKLGRNSYMSCNPFLVLKTKDDRILIEKDGEAEETRGNPFDVLRKLLKRHGKRYEKKRFPFQCGAVGYFGYDLGKFTIKGLPNKAADDIRAWDCCLGFYDSIIAYDNLKREYTLISQSEDGKEELLKLASQPAEKKGEATLKPPNVESNFRKEDYLKAITKAKEYIRKGDIYQVNLSQRFTAETEADLWQLYKRLREINPAPFAAFLNFGDVQVVSASPERFLKVEGRHIETRPIKGTRPRGKDREEDRKLKEELEESEKDRAENIMIVDLERNDLGKVCEYGTVKVSEFEIIEEYATVFQMVSAVEGRLREDVNQVDILRATFPGGSITGAPKVRAMEIIDELEPTKRSAYTGAIGYLSFNGNMDLNIIIRSYILKDGRAYFQVGGGIVADSDPEKEYQETLDKAKALMEALK
ncbi:MAG: aminodeoxychorismate synthase component I [Candidatus Altiarchaeota archaeon]